MHLAVYNHVLTEATHLEAQRASIRANFKKPDNPKEKAVASDGSEMIEVEPDLVNEATEEADNQTRDGPRKGKAHNVKASWSMLSSIHSYHTINNHPSSSSSSSSSSF